MPFQELCELPEFKAWLVTTLEPMCDADPNALADYVEALLKHDAAMSDEEWKIFISRELADFLEDHARPFVEQLFHALQTKSFLAPSAAISESAVVQPPAINPNPPANPPTGPSVISQDRPPVLPEAGPSGKRDSADVDMDGQKQGQGSGSGRQRCFDYHEKGYCMRGANCQYEHDEAVIIPTPEMMFQNMFMPQGPQNGGRGRGGGRGGRGGGRGGTPQHGFPGMPGMPFMPFPFAQPMPPSSDPKSEFWGSNRPPSDRTSTTLVITDIPHQHLSVPELREYFSQFGEVTNIALEGKSKRALLSYGTNKEAYQAWKSDAAVFGSRHVKVLWHRPRPGQGEAGQQALDASRGLMDNLKRMEGGEGLQGSVKAVHSGPQELLQKTLKDLEDRERSSKKESLMAEQKVLFKRTEGATKEEKMKLLGRLKELSKEMEELDKPRPESNVEGGDKERLDSELARLGMETTAGKDQEELMKLNAQLSALKDKATTLGIPATRYSPYGRGQPRGRARGRGRGTYAAARPMRLDNRSRTIHVSGEALQNQEAQTQIGGYYEEHGGNMTALEDGSGVTFTFPNREMAEKVLALGTASIPNKTGELKATWYSEPVKTEKVDVEMSEDSRRGDREEEE